MNELSYPESQTVLSVLLRLPATHTALKRTQCPDGSSDFWQLQAMTRHWDQAVQSQGKPTLEYPEINLVFPITNIFSSKSSHVKCYGWKVSHAFHLLGPRISEDFTYVSVIYIWFGHAVVLLVEALCYKQEGRRFDSQWCHWNFSLT